MHQVEKWQERERSTAAASVWALSRGLKGLKCGEEPYLASLLRFITAANT